MKARIGVVVCLCVLVTPLLSPSRVLARSVQRMRVCHASQLRASADWQGNQTSKVGGVTFSLRNGAACSLQRRPVLLLQVKTRVLDVHEIELAPDAGASATEERTIILRPGHRAGVEFTWASWCGMQIHAPISLSVILPHGGGTASSFVRYGRILRSSSPPACFAAGNRSTLRVGVIRTVTQTTPLP